MTEKFSFQDTGFVPVKLFQYLPMVVRHAMLANIVATHNNTGTATMVGDNMIEVIDNWCRENCTARWCYSDYCLMFESPVDKALFLTARPQK